MSRHRWSKGTGFLAPGDTSLELTAEEILQSIHAFVIDLSGVLTANADVSLIPVGDWDPADPFARSLTNAVGVTADANGRVIITEADNPAEWGGEFDILVKQSNNAFAGLLPAVTIERGHVSLALDVPRISFGCLNAPEFDLDADMSITVTPGDFLAAPATIGDGGIICDTSDVPGVILGGPWVYEDPGVWTGGMEFNCLSVGAPVPVQIWLFNSCYSDFCATTYTITDSHNYCAA